MEIESCQFPLPWKITLVILQKKGHPVDGAKVSPYHVKAIDQKKIRVQQLIKRRSLLSADQNCLREEHLVLMRDRFSQINRIPEHMYISRSKIFGN